METAPNPPPRGGAEPSVSAEDVAALTKQATEWSRDHRRTAGIIVPALALDLCVTIADLRAKLEAAEAERKEFQERLERLSTEYLAITADFENRSRVDREVIMTAIEQKLAAEAALREMTEQRDGAWEAGALAMRDAAALKVKDCGQRLGSLMLAEAIMNIAPPAETAAKEEQVDA